MRIGSASLGRAWEDISRRGRRPVTRASKPAPLQEVCTIARAWLNRLDDPFEFARISHIWKVYDKEKLVELHRQCTLEGLASKIRCPLLVVHGTKDFVPVEQAKRTYDEASGPKEWVLLEGGNHVCNNMPFRYRPLIGDFLAKHLGARTA